MGECLRIETSPAFRPEKEYCFHVLFRELLGLDYQVVFSDQAHYNLQLPGGERIVIEDHFFSGQKEDHYLLPENVPENACTFNSPFDGTPNTAIFGRNHFVFGDKEAVCGVDVFASAFFMLTRWEEYVLPHRDRHQRFPAEKSLAFKAGFLDRPVVNEYALLLRQMFARIGWKLPPKTRQYQLSITCDADHPRLWWTAASRAKTVAASLFKRGDWQEAGYWLKNHVFYKKDPYDVFDEWMDLFEKKGYKGYFNFLGHRPASSDCWYPLEHPFVRNLIRNMAQRGHIVGFHPSYEAFENREVFDKELASLRAVAPSPVTTGRQHYLRFAAPHTWQVWDDAGMAWDSTLGYPEAEGFRCGICQDYPVFNFLTRKRLALREKPLIAMDVTLALYRQYTPETAIERLQYLQRQVERHGGEFVLLWHNSSWNHYFWADWRKVFSTFVS